MTPFYRNHIWRYLPIVVVAVPLMSWTAMQTTASADTTGTATAKGVVVALDASLAGVSTVDANSTIGNVSSPPTTTQSALNLGTSGGVGTTAAGVVTTTATTTASLSEGTAQITGLNYSLLGTSLLQGNGNVISADASCETNGQPTATTNLAGLQVLGQAANVNANTPSVTVSANAAALPSIPGLTSATINATVSSVSTTTATSAHATAVIVNVTLNATILGLAETIPVGTITLADVACTSGTATPATPTTAPTAPATTVPSSSGAATPTTAAPPASTSVKTTTSSAAPSSLSTPTSPSRASSVTPGSPVFRATSVHTGEPWAGSWPYVLVLFGIGAAMVAAGEQARRRHRTTSGQ